MDSGCRKFRVDTLVHHLGTKRHTTRVKTEQVVKIRGQYSGDIELGGHIQNAGGTVSLVLDLLIVHVVPGHLFILFYYYFGGNSFF